MNAIKSDIVAACGMHLEFSNGIVASRIQEVIVFSMDGNNQRNKNLVLERQLRKGTITSPNELPDIEHNDFNQKQEE